jgi:hypothetical protein
MRCRFKPAHALSALAAACLATIPVPALAGQISYTLAQVGGGLSFRTPLSTSWPGGTDTADAQAGVQIAGAGGGNITAQRGNTPVWSGSMAANGAFTASANNGAGAVVPTASSVNYFPLGFWNANRPGGTITIPTAGYFNVTKNTGNASAIMFNTVGNATARGSATWTFVPGFINNDWDGVESSRVARVNPAGAALPANTRAVSDVKDPYFFYLSSPNTLLNFQISLSNIQMDIEGTSTSDGPPEIADAYYKWSLEFGSGETPGQNILYTNSGGQDVTALGLTTLNPGTVVNYNNSSLSAGVYWLTIDFTTGAEVDVVPEPSTWMTAMIGAGGLASLHRRRRAV